MDNAVLMIAVGGAVAVFGVVKFYVMPKIKARNAKKRRSEAAKVGAAAKRGRKPKAKQEVATSGNMAGMNGSGRGYMQSQQGYADADLEHPDRNQIN